MTNGRACLATKTSLRPCSAACDTSAKPFASTDLPCARLKGDPVQHGRPGHTHSPTATIDATPPTNTAPDKFNSELRSHSGSLKTSAGGPFLASPEAVGQLRLKQGRRAEHVRFIQDQIGIPIILKPR